MLCLINITDNKLADWMFGNDLQQLIKKTELQLFMEESPENQAELRELIHKLSTLVYPESGKMRLTSHFYLIADDIDE
ncbi:hypothetical protein [Cesiribacter sp. SM1]|uniref:hypothetical protein n=1 Tax=Cesiribacter sp. SM1 TaxID=2861196 RepID=UPI001CD58B0C|nr:hypothetical protein [Cesiribacter sp. SM1]